MCVQEKDIIIFKANKFSLYDFPLESYWTKKRPKPRTRLTRSTCWRGYLATWEISDNSLYLIDIIFYSPAGDVGIDYLFSQSNGKIEADWYNGELQIPFGNELFYQHMDDPVYDSDWFISIKNGKILSQRYKANY